MQQNEENMQEDEEDGFITESDENHNLPADSGEIHALAHYSTDYKTSCDVDSHS